MVRVALEGGTRAINRKQVGRATFAKNKCVVVDKTPYKAEHIVLAMGCRQVIPDIPGECA